MPRITLASVSLFALSNFVDIKLYEYLKNNVFSLLNKSVAKYAYAIPEHIINIVNNTIKIIICFQIKTSSV